jgi:hypothetical protein
MKIVEYRCDECGREIESRRYVLRLTGPDMKSVMAVDLCETHALLIKRKWEMRIQEVLEETGFQPEE